MLKHIHPCRTTLALLMLLLLFGRIEMSLAASPDGAIGQSNSSQAESSYIEKAPKQVVLIKSYQQQYDWLAPWNKTAILPHQGVALVIDTQYLLTTAELVINNTLIEVTKSDSPYPFHAEVVRMDYAANLALLQVLEKEFWQNMEPVEWGEAEVGTIEIVQRKPPKQWEMVPGTIEKLEMVFRFSSRKHLPMLKIQGTQLKGGEGTAIVQKGKVVAMGMQSGQGGLNASPVSFLKKFISSPKSSYSGFPSRGFGWQSIPQIDILEAYNVDPQLSGVWVTRTLHYGTGSDVLRSGDFLFQIGNWPISNEGHINHPKWGQVLFDYLFVEEVKTDDQITFHVVRDGKKIELKSRVVDVLPSEYFVPLKQPHYPPKYVLRGGLLFQRLSIDYLNVWGKNWSSRAPARLRIFQQLDAYLPENKDQHVVLLTRILPDAINIGYQELRNLVVTQINGKPINNLNDVVEAFKNPKDGFHQVEFLPGYDRYQLILPEKELSESNKRILENFKIPQLQVLP